MMDGARWNYGDYSLTEVNGGLRVDWHGMSYLAKKWKITDRLINFITTCFKNGMTCAFPPTYVPGITDEKEWKYLAFGSPECKRGILALDQFSKGVTDDRNNLEQVTFRNTCQTLLTRNKVPWKWEFHGGKNVFVQYNDAVNCNRSRGNA